MANAKALEDSITMYSKTIVARDVKKPIGFQVISKPAEVNTTEGTWYNITQDNQVIGRLYKYVDDRFPKGFYDIWKKAAPGATLQGKSLAFVPLITTKGF